ncbi:hypothetical protein M3Y95_00887600 [Aphelenchoides besseyi]|nr:hypothetical protein M3Y95_00887600 [Aphelenchoides besseyi]
MRFLFLLLLFVSVDSKVYREVQLTDSGIHSSPRFDKNGTSIHVVANGGQYETDCDHVYRIDLRTPQQPISLVSLGIGQEDGPSFGTSIFSSTDLYGLRTAGVNMVMKTTRNNAFTNNKFCLRKICSNPTDVIRDACNRPHIERFRDSEYAFFNPTTTFEDSQVSTSPNVPLRVQNRALESHVYTLLGTSVNYYDLPFNKTSQSYIRTNSLINGFDAFSDLGDAKVIFHAAPVGDDGSALEAGVEVLDKYEIYETTWNDLANGNFKVQTPIVKKPTNGYLTNPRFLRDGTNRFFYTFTDLIGNSQIRLHTPGQLNDDMVLDQAKDIDVFYKDSTIFVTYVSNKNGKNWQVYMGTYNADTQFPTISVPSPVAYDSRTPFFENTRSIYKPEFETPFHLRFSDNGDWLMFAGEENYDANIANRFAFEYNKHSSSFESWFAFP